MLRNFIGMNTQILVVDDFYENPYDVREFALSQEFNVSGNFPNLRTEPDTNPSLRETLQNIVRSHGGAINYWPDGYNGAYQFTTSRDRSWIHSDTGTMWAAVCYLTPNAPFESGTGLYRHKETGLYSPIEDEKIMKIINEDSQDMTKWEELDVVGNVYNRLVMYRGNRFHCSRNYFGQDKYTGRLFQTFFFSTEF